jgi:hypothetical protein
VRPVYDGASRSEPSADEWLLIEWPEGEAEHDHYWLFTLPADLSIERMIGQTKLHWRIGRDYLGLEQEAGLGHYEGRGWLGFHHHATLWVAAYGVRVSEKETIPSSGPSGARRGAAIRRSTSYQPRGSADAVAKAHAELGCLTARPSRPPYGSSPAMMSLLRSQAANVSRTE